MIKRKIAVIVALLLMAGFAVYFGVTLFATSSLRLDEAQSLFQTNRDLQGIFYLVAQDVHVPLYHTILHYWLLLFGQDIFVARLLSLVFFVATIFMTYALAKLAFHRRSAGLFAALLVTLSPFMNWYGSEARMYTMLAFMATLHAYLFLKLMRSGGKTYWIVWTLTGILGLYTHYFFAFVLLSEFIALILMRKQFMEKHSHAIREMMIAGIICALSVLPWLLYVYKLGFASNTQPALSEPSAGDLFDTYAQFIFGFQVPAVNTIIVSLWPIVVLLGFFALQRRGRKIPDEVTLFVALATLPVMLAFIISVTIRPFYLSRYLIVSLPALVILVAWLLTRYRKPLALTVGSVLVAVMGLLFVVQVLNPNTPVKEDYRDAVHYIDTHAEATDTVVLSAPFTIYPVEYYYQGQAKLTTQPIWDRFSSGAVPAFDASKLDEETKQNVSSYRHAWLMLSYDQGYNEKLKNYYDAHFEKLSEKKFSSGIVVYEYKIRYDKPLELSDVQ